MTSLYLAILVGLVVLLVLILILRIPAFISLLIASICTGLGAGLNAEEIISTIQKGMGGTLGFVATVVGLGAIFGGILEKTNGAKILARSLLNRFGEKRSSWALMLIGFLVAIPVFFDVGIIILFPILYAVHKRTKKSLIFYALPLLAGLAVTHACIPPTPGPIAVAQLVQANLGWVILFGFVIGIPMAIVGGVWYSRYLGRRLNIQLDLDQGNKEEELIDEQGLFLILFALLLPILLIIMGTLTKENIIAVPNVQFREFILLIGHPFSALIIANLFAWYILGKRSRLSTDHLVEVSSKSLYPVGIIILVTGAGGVYKETLIDTGAGELIANQLQSMGWSILVFSFIAALIVRVMQGSATVAMITAGGLVAPLLSSYTLNPMQLACLVIAISSGATAMSHLNDSGFWLVKEYLRLDETNAMKTWTVASTLIGLTGFVLSYLCFLLVD